MACLSPSEAYRILINGEHSDFTITCQKQQWRVHKLFICAASTYCHSLVRAGHNRLNFPYSDPAAIQLMLEWFYCKQYMNPSISAEAWAAFRATNDTESKALVLHAPDHTDTQPSVITDNELKHAILLDLKVFALATCFGSEGLRVYAGQQFYEKIVVSIFKRFLVDILKAVWTLTTVDDKLVRLPLFRTCLTRLHGLREQLPDAATFLEEVEPQGCFFADLAHTRGVRIKQLQESLDEHDQKLRAGY